MDLQGDRTMTRKLEGKVALVTGAAQGIGAASAVRLAAEGADVVIADILEERGRATAEQIVATGGRASFVNLDVTKEDAWEAALTHLRECYGALHILLNNAGIGRPAPLTEMSYDTFRLIFAINVDGMFLGMKHAIPLIAASGGGSIMNLSSAASKKVYANMSAYCASKAGIAQLTKVAALECAQNRTKIRVNSIHPGIVETPAWKHLGALEGAPASTVIDLDAMAAATVPLGHKAVPDDIANVVLFLASDESAYITGAEFVVDGGQVLL
jgi:NAD(P)-dependent dehydrogenase (short-subunit alcohol dehydrogenase family)